jgi:hypothetical protein
MTKKKKGRQAKRQSELVSARQTVPHKAKGNKQVHTRTTIPCECTSGMQLGNLAASGDLQVPTAGSNPVSHTQYTTVLCAVAYHNELHDNYRNFGRI